VGLGILIGVDTATSYPPRFPSIGTRHEVVHSLPYTRSFSYIPRLNIEQLALRTLAIASPKPLFFAVNRPEDNKLFCLRVVESHHYTARSVRGGSIYYGNLRYPSGEIVHLGDNLTGEGEGDDEQILMDLPSVPAEIVRLAIVVNMYRCRQRQQDFGQVRNAFLRLVDRVSGQELARYHLSGRDYQGMTGMILAEIYR
jgi:TerD domain